jgi:uncharacterized protein (DUF4415 family)
MNGKERPTTWTDPDDAPDLSSPEWRARFEAAPLMEGDRVVRRGRPPKPAAERKVSLTLKIDPQVLAHYRATGPGWQTRMHEVLAAAAKPEKKAG